MCSSKYDYSVKEYSSVGQICRLCLVAKKTYVDIFSTTTGDGCPLVEKLNESLGIQWDECHSSHLNSEEMYFVTIDVSRGWAEIKGMTNVVLDLIDIQAFVGDELPRCVCIDCLRQVRFLNISHCLWSTIDYLIRMEEDNEKLTSSFHIPEDTLDFLLKDRAETSPISGGQRNDNCDEMGVGSDSCGSKGRSSGPIEGGEHSSDESFEYCWCPECNAEFLSREELKTHRKTHNNSASINIIGVDVESEVSLEEIGLLSGELSISKSKLCCGKCEREFRDEGRLVAHINKHDFKCKPRNFEVLNAQLRDLRSIRTKSNALGRSRSESALRRVDSTCVEGGRSLQSASLTFNGEERNSLGGECVGSGGGGVVKGRLMAIRNEIGGSTSRKSLTDVSEQSGVDRSEGEFRKENCPVLVEVSSRKSLKKKELSLDPLKNSNQNALLSSQSDGKSTHGRNESNVDCLFYCDYCNKPSECKSTLRKHIVICHLSVEVHKCTVCHFVFPTDRELKTHAALHTSDNKYICSVCSSNFTSKKHLIVHLNEHHSSKNSGVCSICLTGFQSRVELSFHRLSHLDEKRFICQNCEKCLFTKRSMRRHLRSCLKLKSFKCEICHRVFYSKNSLNYHLNTHDTRKRARCLQCQKTFACPSTLFQHVRLVHLKLKPHECGVCQKKFGLRGDLEKHYVLHSDDRPFFCHLCGKSFKLKAHVKTHLRVVHLSSSLSER